LERGVCTGFTGAKAASEECEGLIVSYETVIAAIAMVVFLLFAGILGTHWEIELLDQVGRMD
jgi:hypothetical protein